MLSYHSNGADMHLWPVSEQGKESLEVSGHTRIMIRVLNGIFTAPVGIDNHCSSITTQERCPLEAWKTRNDGFMPFLYVIQHPLQVLRFDRQFHYFRDSTRPVTISDNGHLS